MLVFIDRPGKPENLQPSDVHAEYCKLSWQAPADDGGAEISGKFRVAFLFSEICDREHLYQFRIKKSIIQSNER